MVETNDMREFFRKVGAFYKSKLKWELRVESLGVVFLTFRCLIVAHQS